MQVAVDHRAAGLDPSMSDLAEKVAGDATSVSEADFAPLRGLSDEEIFDVVLAASGGCFFSKTLDLDVQADAEYAEVEPNLRGRSLWDARSAQPECPPLH